MLAPSSSITDATAESSHTEAETAQLHYRRIAAAIAYLQEHALDQPQLADLAHAIGLSEFALQRSFSSFAGVSPKRFLQYLTKEHAKMLLRSQDVLNAAFGAGLSSPGRLHDLMVSCEAVTPGEVRRRGAGLQLRHALVQTPVGPALAACSTRGLVFLGFVEEPADLGLAAALSDLRARWPLAQLVEDSAVAEKMQAALSAWWASGHQPQPLHLMLAGTNLQLKVWEALLAVPPGRLVTYQQLAQAVGEPRAVRAVASAVGRNPVSVLIPCHRVIRGTGELGGYHWGLPRKAALIALESARADA